MFGRFFDYNNDGRSDLAEIVGGMNSMGLFDEDARDEYDDDYDDDSDDEW